MCVCVCNYDVTECLSLHVIVVISVVCNKTVDGVLIELVSCEFNPIITLRDNVAVSSGFLRRV